MVVLLRGMEVPSHCNTGARAADLAAASADKNGTSTRTNANSVNCAVAAKKQNEASAPTIRASAAQVSSQQRYPGTKGQ